MALVQAGTAGVRSLGRAPPPHGASPAGSLRTTCPRGPRAPAACCRLPRTACGPCRVGQAAVAASRVVCGPRIMRLVVRPPLLLTQRAPARRASFAGAQWVGPSRLGRGAAGPRPPVLAVRRAEPLAGVVFGQASTHMMRTAW